MNKMDYLNSIYNDFFGDYKVKEEINNSQESKDDDSLFSQIDLLYITDESKILLKKIIDYMNRYKDNNNLVYIPIRLIINSNSDKTIKDVINILSLCSKSCSYTKCNDYLDYSLYKMNKDVDFTKYGIVNINKLSGINLEDDKMHKLLMHNIELCKDNESIIIISGNNDEITNFFLGYDDIKNNGFNFSIDGISPSIQDVYNNIINKINITDDMKVKLLDYITKTYIESLDYNNYQNELIKYISFNNELPSIKINKSIDEVFSELDSLVGLDKVKKVLRELVDLISLKDKTKDKLNISNVNLHMVFLGNPGTGKTTIARMVASILYNLGYIKENKLVEVSSKDLVAEYVGQTASKTASIIEKSLNGVLFIDEAYTLAVDGSNSYNDEAIATLIQAMENYRDKLVVIFAGYTKEMQAFLDSNSGIVSRIGYTLQFDDYTTDELIKIFKNMASKSGFIVEDGAIEYLKTIIDENRNIKNFGNARFIRNIYEKTIIKHASRVKNNKQNKILITITKDDISTENLIMN